MGISGLTSIDMSTQQEKVAEVAAVANVERKLARQLLVAHGWDVQLALQTFFAANDADDADDGQVGAGFDGGTELDAGDASDVDDVAESDDDADADVDIDDEDDDDEYHDDMYVLCSVLVAGVAPGSTLLAC